MSKGKEKKIHFDFEKKGDSKTYTKLIPYAHIIRDMRFKDIHYFGLENIPKEGGFIIACNHINFFDPGHITIAAHDAVQRPVHCMCKSDPFENAFWAKILTAANAFPVVRGRADFTSINYAVDLINSGKIVAIFPEGTRSRDGRLGRPKNGISLIARAAHADVLPMSIYNIEGAKKNTRMTIRFGEMIPYEKLGLTDDGDSHELKNATNVIWEAVTKLWGNAHCEEECEEE